MGPRSGPPADVSRCSALLREERHATGGDEQLFFHRAPPRSRLQRRVRNVAGAVNRARLSNSLLLGRRRPQNRELVGDLELSRAEAEDSGRAAAAAAGGAPLAGSLGHAPA